MSLQRLSHIDARAWRAPLVLAAVLVLVQFIGAPDWELLRYDRAAVLAGQGWRLLTAHFIHADAVHLGWNLAGLALVAWLFAGEFSWRDWLLILAGSTVAVDAGFLAFEPGLEWYVGFSGVLHGLAAAGLCAWLRRERDWITLVVAALLVAKLAWEQFEGPLPVISASLTVPVIYQAHTYGALGGLAVAAWLAMRVRASVASL